MDPRERFTGPTNELAKERNRAAAERTIAAWISSSTALIGFGLAIAPIYNRLKILFPGERLIVASTLSYTIGLIFMLLGIVLPLIAMMQHYLAVRSLERDDYVFIPSGTLNGTAATAVTIFGVLGILTLLLTFH